jgi:hypothetical protein
MFNLCYEHTKDPIFSASNAKRKATLWKHVTSGKRLIPAVKAFIDVGYDVSASIPNAAQSACGACKIIKKDKVDLWRPGGRWVWESDGG